MRYIVIMAGGSGTRFWPLSRKNKPKQFLSLTQESSLIQQTVQRVLKRYPIEQILIVTNTAQFVLLKEQLPDFPEPNILLEPQGRDTAAAIGLATMVCAHRNSNAMLAILPSDQIILPEENFLDDLEQAFHLAGESIVTLGIPPHSPHPGFGYIQRGQKLGEDFYDVQRFVEKPNLARAKEYLASGDYYWNAGIFIFHQKTMHNALTTRLPILAEGLSELRPSLGTTAFPQALSTIYPRLPKISIDFGLMEKFRPIRMQVAHFQWDDVGSLNAFERYHLPDAHKNTIIGEFLGIETEKMLVYSPNHLVAALGVKDLAIIHTEDVTLILPKERLEEIKKLVQDLETQPQKHHFL